MGGHVCRMAGVERMGSRYHPASRSEKKWMSLCSWCEFTGNALQMKILLDRVDVVLCA